MEKRSEWSLILQTSKCHQGSATAPVRSVPAFIQGIGHTLPCLTAQPLVTSRVTEPTFQNVFSTVLCPVPAPVGKLWWLLWDLFWAFFRASCSREEEKANSAMWKSFHLAIPAALARSCGGPGGEEGRGNLPTNPMPTTTPMRREGSFSQPCSSGAASVQARLPRQVASQAGRINKR